MHLLTANRETNEALNWLPSLFWAACIFVFSSSLFSSANTSRIFIPILHWLMPAASSATVVAIHLAIRKMAHFSEYGVLFLLLVRGPLKTRPHVALAVCALYALLDEGHQLFVPSRSPSIYDVGVDFSGALFSNFIRSALSALAKA